MVAPYSELGSLDDWLLAEAIAQAKRAIAIEDELIPEAVEQLGQPCVCLYATLIFDGEVANGGLHQFFDNTSGALAPVVRDALRAMGLREYAAIMTQVIDSFGHEYPYSQQVRLSRMDAAPDLQAKLDRSYDAIDVWSSEFILARETYARNHGLIA